MTVKELYDWCKTQKDKNAEVYMCKDYEQIDEDGNLTDLYRLKGISTQTRILDMGFDWEEETDVILEFSNDSVIVEDM